MSDVTTTPIDPGRLALVSRLPAAVAPFGVDLSPAPGYPGLFTCPCSCAFWPETDDGELYPDRFEMAGGCEEPDCACHDLPRCVPDPGPAATVLTPGT